MNNRKEHQDNSKSRILIVDDHMVVRQGLTLLIDQEPDLVVCAEAENAGEALETIQKQEVDLAIVDISLDGPNGIQLTERIKSRHPHLPVLVLTMHDEELYVKRAFQAGAKGYITKHEAAETIITAIRLMLSGKDYISETMKQKFLKKLNSKGSHC
ncbi:MAG: response regulator [Planctomycetota bacterium]|jgi:DNA-binding NarL/FixJ family response regulator